jgi:hypothetical protein
MGDEQFTSADGHITEVLLPVIDNYLRTNVAFLTMGLAQDLTGELDWSRGGKHVTRVTFEGGLSVNRLGATNNKQKVTYGERKHPVISNIVSPQFARTGLEDVFDNEGTFNRTTREIQYRLQEQMDSDLISYQADIGEDGGSKEYGALGTTLEHLAYATEYRTLSYDNLVICRGKFGDSAPLLVAVVHPNCMTDLLLTTETKNMQMGIAIGNQTGVLFPTLNTIAIASSRVKVVDKVYQNLLCATGAMGYGWKRPLSVQPKYEGDDVWTYDFIWRYAILRETRNGRELTARLETNSNQA